MIALSTLHLRPIGPPPPPIDPPKAADAPEPLGTKTFLFPPSIDAPGCLLGGFGFPGSGPGVPLPGRYLGVRVGVGVGLANADGGIASGMPSALTEN